MRLPWKKKHAVRWCPAWDASGDHVAQELESVEVRGVIERRPPRRANFS